MIETKITPRATPKAIPIILSNGPNQESEIIAPKILLMIFPKINILIIIINTLIKVRSGGLLTQLANDLAKTKILDTIGAVVEGIKNNL